ncbi:protein tyrosine phosphatase [Variovorax humicola]|uniref:Protein tyrosine phosphatase n=1 Tax=Variovorax humicola TaxID=1769758 RepID=A0ABU8W6Q1_9BURK
MQERFRVVFVSRRNSLRSILAAACLAHLDGARFVAISCGAPGHVAPAVHPAAIDALGTAHIPVPAKEPCSWATILRGPPSRINFVILLDESIETLLPPWPGQPDFATWPFPDVAAESDPETAARAAIQVLHSLRRRLELLIALTMRGTDRAAIRSDVRELGHMI